MPHTPGPWTAVVDKGECLSFWSVYDSNRTWICDLGIGPNAGDDACLMAAAPALLAACKAAEPLLRLLAAKTNNPKNVVATLNAVAATIDLAEGA